MTRFAFSWSSFPGVNAVVCGAVIVGMSAAQATAQSAAASPAQVRSGGQAAVERIGRTDPAIRLGLGSSAAISPVPQLSFYAFPFVSVFGPPAPNLGYPQPLGHQIIPTGPNGYIYRPVANLGDFLQRAVAALREANYAQVLVELDPLLTETPDDGDVWLLRAQAMFGLADYGKAAESLHVALRVLPREEWGRPIVKRRDYFRSPEEYTARLRALESYVRLHPDVGAGHFLLGYHYGYLGRATEAERELQTALQLMTGSDELAHALLAPAADTSAAPRPRPGLLLDEELPRTQGPREF
ncbi:MAG TPA: hypothetical protein VGG64_11245 [Pirellulales bacterium]